MAKYPEKYEDTKKFYFDTLEDGISKVRQLWQENKWSDIRLQLRPFSTGHKISIYCIITANKRKAKPIEKDILMGILDVQNQLANEIKNIKNKLNDMGY